MAAASYLTIERLTRAAITRLFSKISVDTSTGCWQWTGCVSSGYGMARFRGPATIVHRITYAWLVGPIPNGIKARKHAQLDHLCRNRICCNPAHLELVSQAVNVNRGATVQKTHCHRGHVLPHPKHRHPGGCRECRAALEQSEQRKQWKKADGAARYAAIRSDPARYAAWLERAKAACRRSRAKRRHGHHSDPPETQ